MRQTLMRIPLSLSFELAISVTRRSSRAAMLAAGARRVFLVTGLLGRGAAAKRPRLKEIRPAGGRSFRPCRKPVVVIRARARPICRLRIQTTGWGIGWQQFHPWRDAELDVG